MYGVSNDYVMTYDTNFLQEHSDSSDFEELCPPLLDIRKGNHSLVKAKKQKIKTKNNPQFHTNNTNIKNTPHLYIDCDEYPVKLKKEIKTLPKETKNKYSKKHERKLRSSNKATLDLNSGDQAEPTKTLKPKLSLIKHKVIPCISNIFKRNNSFTKHHMLVIEENQDGNTRTSTGYQRCNNCEQRRLRKLYKRQQNYVVQPIYAIEGNSHKNTIGPFTPTKVIEEQILYHNRKTKNQNFSHCSLSSSESDFHCARERQQKVEMFRKRLKSEIIKEHIKYQQNQQIQTQPIASKSSNPSKENKYHVFATPIHSTTLVAGYNDHHVGKIPSSTSSFWEYLYDKTTACGKKCQTQRAETPAQSGCPAQQEMHCKRSKCCVRQNMDKSNGSYDDLSGKGKKPCTCKETAVKQRNSQPSPDFSKNKDCDPSCIPPECCDPVCSTDTIKSSDTVKTDVMKKKQKNKVKCQCPLKSKLQNKKNPKIGSKSSRDNFTGSQKLQDPQRSQQNFANQNKPCQEGHDDIVLSLAQKYNGEVLCIHNPPCILINGCLNLPPQKEQQEQNNEMTFWPVTGSPKHDFYNQTATATNQTSFMNREQSCQYHVMVSQATENKAEKIIQSICQHNPPCKVVRGCYKTKFDPQLENSCVHVPMCKQIPECVVIDRRRKCCEHRPRCRDIPICSRDFVTLTAKENVGTQAKYSVVHAPKKNLICRHEPPCIMIPKCIGKAMCDSSYVNVDAIPGCIHQPSCPLIPACCRKSAKEMNNVGVGKKPPRVKRHLFRKMKPKPTYSILDTD